MGKIGNKGLTIKQKIFADAHNGNTTEAAAIAGLSESYARHLMMDSTKPHAEPAALAVQERIKARNRDNPAILSRIERQELWSRWTTGKEKPTPEQLKASELLAKSELDFAEKGGDNQAAIIVQINAPGVPIQPLGTPIEQRSLPTGSTEPPGTDTEQGGT